MKSKILKRMLTSAATCLKDNTESIVTAVTFAAVGAVLRACGISTPLSFQRDVCIPRSPYDVDYDTPLIPTTSDEAAIVSLLNSAKSMIWDSDRVKIGRQIYTIAAKSKATDEEKIFAITALSKIANLMDWSSDKQIINQLIFSIANGDSA